GGSPRSEQRRRPPHPPVAAAPGPSLSPRKRAERGTTLAKDRCQPKNVHALALSRGRRTRSGAVAKRGVDAVTNGGKGMAHGMTRREFAAAAGAAGLIGIGLSARAKAADTKTLRFIAQSDLRALDPIWTTAGITRNHGYMVYDT